MSSAENAVVAALVGKTIREATLEVAHEEEVEENRLARLAPPALSSLSQVFNKYIFYLQKKIHF